IPVEEQSTISFSSFSFFATSSVMRYAFNRPTSPVAQFALPLFTTTAWALPLFRCSWQTRTGAARVLLGVNVPLATQGTSQAKIARSGIEVSDLMPQDVIPARKPCGAFTQLSISRKISGNARTSSSYGKKFLVPENISQSNVANLCWELKTGNEELVACLHCTMWSQLSTTPRFCLFKGNIQLWISFQRCPE